MLAASMKGRSKMLVHRSRRSFGWFGFGKRVKSRTDGYEQCHVVLNFKACEMGRLLVDKIAKKAPGKRVIAVAADVKEQRSGYSEQVEFFEADLGEKEGLAELINYMHECKYSIETLFHNYPRILKIEGEENSLDHFKDIMAQIIQQPMITNSEILQEELICADPSASERQATIFHSILRQKGIYSILQGTFMHMERCLESDLKKHKTSVVQIDPGIYSSEHLSNIPNAPKSLNTSSTQIIPAEVVAETISSQIINHRVLESPKINLYDLLSEYSEPPYYKEIK
ncbi:unnamed protein product [Moneuplotes crassus]|uniref:Uncharacterized protein n=1 Tax=Euplotes crassus TaxID=5936 RepID=A0AAD2D1D3_EUPCR|nr:unnamed protein product [Moneuplotes crassus]